MAGTLTIGTLSDGTNSTSSTNAIKGSAKAWVNFNGTGTVAIRASYNVSSITDNGTGNYTVNFTNAMSDTNYSVVGSLSGWTGTGVGRQNALNTNINASQTFQARTTTQVWINSYTGGAQQDVESVEIAIFR